MRCDTLTVEKESHTGDVLSLPVTEGIHKLSKSRGALDLEKNLIVIIRDLDVEMFALAGILGLLGNVG